MLSKQRDLEGHGGRVVSIQLDDDRCAVGQVAGTFLGYGHDVYLAVFEGALDLAWVRAEWQQALTKPVALIGICLDDRIQRGQWPTLGFAPIASHIRLPAYRVLTGEGSGVHTLVVDYSGHRSRRAAPAEEHLLQPQKSYSSGSFENAVKADHGLLEWNEKYFGALRPKLSTLEAFGTE